MSKEQIRLLKLLRKGKISEADFILISEAINKKSAMIYTLFNFLLNPYHRISGIYGLLLGGVIVVLLSALALPGLNNFPSLTSYMAIPLSKKNEFNFVILLGQNLVICATLSILFIIASNLCQQKGLRVIDFTGMVMVSRFPYLVITAIMAIINTIHNGASALTQNTHSIIGALLLILIMLCALWALTMLSSGFKEVSGLNGNKLWISFLVCLILGESLSFFIISFFIWVN